MRMTKKQPFLRFGSAISESDHINYIDTAGAREDGKPLRVIVVAVEGVEATGLPDIFDGAVHTTMPSSTATTSPGAP